MLFNARKDSRVRFSAEGDGYDFKNYANDEQTEDGEQYRYNAYDSVALNYGVQSIPALFYIAATVLPGGIRTGGSSPKAR